MNEVPAPIVVPLHITVAVESTGGGIITDKPVLVEILTAAGRMHHDRIAPGSTAIGRLIDDYGCTQDIAAGNSQRGDQPGVVSSVVGNRGIADTSVRTSRSGED